MEIETRILGMVIFGLAALCVYYIILRRAADVVQPLRLKMAVLGERILLSCPSTSRASQIRFYLDNAFSGWVMPAAAVLLPVAALLGVVKHFTGRFELTHESNKEDRKIALLFTASTFAANPFFGLIVAVEFLIISALLLIAAGPPTLMAALEEFARVEVAVLERRRRAERVAVLV
jgi:hypothetical protein